MRVLLSILLLWLGVTCTAAAQDSADDTTAAGLFTAFRSIEQTAFAAGERLVFDVGYSFITAGEAVMAIPAIDTVEGRPAYRVTFTVRSTPTFSIFFRVEDLYETLLDVDGIFPWRSVQRIREGKYQRDFDAAFDQRRQIARTGEKEYAVPLYVHDILSAFYYTRTVRFDGMRIGQKFFLQNFYKDSTYLLAVKFLGRQRISVPAGTFDCLIVEPLIKEGGLFKSEGRVIIWLTDDERRIPVKVSTQVIIGSIDAELREYTGINGPVRARIR
jgi:hypothetical protein